MLLNRKIQISLRHALENGRKTIVIRAVWEWQEPALKLRIPKHALIFYECQNGVS